MSNTETVEVINSRLTELKNVIRIVQNAFNLISDSDIKGGHANAVAEILSWLAGFGKTLQTQVDALNAALPKEETKVEEVKAEIVESKA